MKTAKEIIIFFCICVVICFACCITWYAAIDYQFKQKPQITEAKKSWVYDDVVALQKRVGAKQDGIVGIETSTKTNRAVQAEEPNRFNEYASRYMTPTGAPK